MKYAPPGERIRRCGSPPAWGAWIEIKILVGIPKDYESPPAWGAWIEICNPGNPNHWFKSPPAWGAWIEIFFLTSMYP